MSISTAEVKRFTCEFSGMINEGETLVRSLAALAQQQQNKDFRQVITQVQQDVTGNGVVGVNLSVAMSKHPSVFHQSQIEVVRQGESNDLKSALRQLCST